MFEKNFEWKIYLLFLVPAVAMLYLSYYFVSDRYQDVQDAKRMQFSAHLINASAKMVHEIQKERGFGAGYLASKGANRSLYLNQLPQTDKSYKSLLEQLHSLKHFPQQLFTQGSFKSFMQHYQSIETVRIKIQHLDISFEKELEYYSRLNDYLLESIYSLSSIFCTVEQSYMTIYHIQKLKEYMGLERAYVYNAILSKNYSPTRLQKIRYLIQNEEKELRKFINSASIEMMLAFDKHIKKDTNSKLIELQKAFFAKQLRPEDASHWFAVITRQIDEYEAFSDLLLKDYLNTTQKIYNKAIQALLSTFILWILSIVAFFVILFILNRLIKKEHILLEDLKIASFTFEAQQPIAITDADGHILRVNNAFCQTTGYTKEEVLGKNLRTFGTLDQDSRFYDQIWEEIEAKGHWNGETFNRRKDGKIVIEKLSISAIRSQNGNIEYLIATYVDVSALKQAQQEAYFQATHDHLTELPNRALMIDKLKDEFIRAKRHNYLDAFMFIDLDGFKDVNDTYGHKVGDQLLIEVAKRLQNSVRQEDFIARISGDEFAAIIQNLSSNENFAAQTVKLLAERIVHDLSQPYYLYEHVIHISASIGIKLFPDGIRDINEIITSADTAMYKAKEEGKNRFVFFNKNIELSIRELALFEEELKNAFEHEQFVFYLQPKVHNSLDEIKSAEMLVRWDHPHKGVLPPSQFLKMVHSLKLDRKLSLLAVEKACLFLHKHRNFYSGNISININAGDLASKEFISEIKKRIEHYRLDPSRIELEILENELIEDFEKVIANMQELQRFGSVFAIDDFGTGYSSIGYLQKLPVEMLKVDRSFVAEIDKTENQALLQMVLELAKTFNLELVVEGIETKEQLQILQNMGVREFQGFYFSKPLSQEQFIALIKKQLKIF